MLINLPYSYKYVKKNVYLESYKRMIILAIQNKRA